MSKTGSKTSPHTYSIPSSGGLAKGQRADKALAGFSDLPSRSQLKIWFENGYVTRNGKALLSKTLVFPGDVIQVVVPEMRQMELEPREVALRILHEDADLIVLYKPRGLSMHPGASRKDETTLVHALLALSAKLSDRSGEFRPGIVHRLDKDTEGIVVVAKNNETHEDLSEQFASRKIDRAYWALCYGKVPEKLTVEGNIGRHSKNRKMMAVTAKGKIAITHFKRLLYFSEGYSLVECKLMTGRTHQIRVHLSHKGYGVLGDPVYGKKRRLKWSDEKQAALDVLKGQALVAFRLGFIHPKTQEKLSFEVEHPEWLKIFLKD